jgi:hypothetical protein
MSMVDVVRMGVRMGQRLVPVPVRMRDLGQLFGRVLVLVVLVMLVLVRVLEGFVRV